MADIINKSTLEALDMSGIQDLSHFGRDLHKFCRGFYQPIYERHRRAYRFYLGDQWRYYRRRGLAMPTYNVVGPYTDIIASNLTDSMIMFQVSPKNQDDIPMIRIWNEILRQACEQDSFHINMYGLLIDTLVKGYSIVKICPDDKRTIPVSIQVIDPYNYMGEPGIRRPDINGNYHWHSEWKTAMEVRRMYPEKWRDVKYASAGQEGSYDNYEFLYERSGDMNYTRMALIHELHIKTDETERIPRQVTEDELVDEHRGFLESRPPIVILEQNHSDHMESHEAQITEISEALRQKAIQGVMQGQLQPEELEDVVAEAIATNPIIKLIQSHNTEHIETAKDNPNGIREKYNGWRRIVFGGPDWVSLDDGGALIQDAEGRGRHPFVIQTSPATGTDIYEWSVLERCMSLQELMNLWMGKFQDHLSLCSCPAMGFDSSRVTLEPNQLVALAGLVIPTNGNPSECVTWFRAPDISGQLIQNYFQLREQIEVLMGVSDVEKGGYPPMERASAPMLQAIQEASRARWREYQREYQDFLRRCGEVVLMVLQKEMTAAQQLRIGRVKEEYELLNQPSEDENGNMVKLNDLSRGEYDVHIKLTPLTALLPDAKLQRAITLFSTANPQGITIYDLDAVADDSEDPVIIESVARQKAFQQQMMAMQQRQAQAETAKTQQEATGV